VTFPMLPQARVSAIKRHRTLTNAATARPADLYRRAAALLT
jgi:hypothetical protein